MSRLLAALLAFSCKDPVEAPAFALQPTVERIDPDPLSGSGRTSCPVYLEERCEGGVVQRCEIFDAGAGAFVDEPDPLIHRVYLYDRWYDRFSSPLGLTGERVFVGAMPGSAPESVWTSSASFAGWAGMGDAGIWTGAALVSDIFRYTATRTEADYLRMEEKTRALIRSFQVTGIPGYLSRYHFLQVPEGTPQDDRLILQTREPRSI